MKKMGGKMTTRRELLLGAAVIAATGVGLSLPASAQDECPANEAPTLTPQVPPRRTARVCRVRGAVGTLQNDENLRTFARAVRIMKGDHPTNAISQEIRRYRAQGREDCHPLSWERQVTIHRGPWDQHWTWRFLPWHRLQLLNFEQIVIQVTGDECFALPFWDPREAQRLPVDFRIRTGSASGSEVSELRNALYVQERSVDANSATFDFREALEWYSRHILAGRREWGGCRFENRSLQFLHDTNLLHLAGYKDASGRVEFATHGTVHGLIGGWMGSIRTAPKDPMFWLHHANVDRVWATWQDQHKFISPESTAYRDANQLFLDERIADAFVAGNCGGTQQTWSPSKYPTCRDVLNIRKLGYDYDPLYHLPAFAPDTDKSSWDYDGTPKTTVVTSDASADAYYGKPAQLQLHVADTYRPVRSAEARTDVSAAELKLTIERAGFETFNAAVSIGATGASERVPCELISPFGFDHGEHSHGSSTFTLSVASELAAVLQKTGDIVVQVVAEPHRSLNLSRHLRIEKVSISITSQRLKRR
jgi:hypothetical protein